MTSDEQNEGTETSRSQEDNDKIGKTRKPSDEKLDGPANGLSREK